MAQGVRKNVSRLKAGDWIVCDTRVFVKPEVNTRVGTLENLVTIKS